jgi:hypothetical protein
MSVKDQIVGILNSSETSRIRFSFTGLEGTVNVEPGMFHSVASAIRRNQISIVENHFDEDIAMYSARANSSEGVAANTLYLGRNQRSSRLFNALIVHEAVHAAFDISSRSMPWIDNETAGYIAQAYYARNSGLPRTAYEFGSHSIVAFSIVEGIRNHSDSDITFFLDALRANLRRDDRYASYINGHFDGDGIG